MIHDNNILVVDIDGTLCPIKEENQSYDEVMPYFEIVDKLRTLHKNGWYIIINSSRGMASKNGNIGKINVEILPTIVNWLKKHDIPHNEIHVAKPWPGKKGFYIDDRSVRPKEFLDMDIDELEEICNNDKL